MAAPLAVVAAAAAAGRVPAGTAERATTVARELPADSVDDSLPLSCVFGVCYKTVA